MGFYKKEGILEVMKKTIAECLRKRFRESPDKIALETDEQQYTWRDLDILSNYMAARMLSCEIRKGTRVGIWSTNSPNWIIVFLALMKIGAVAVPLNTSYTMKEMTEVLRCTAAEVVYYGEGDKSFVFESMVMRLKEELKDQVRRWIYTGRDTSCHWMTGESFVFSERMKKAGTKVRTCTREVNPDDAAVLLFTSGSMAMFSHENLVNSSLEFSRGIKWKKIDELMIANPLFQCSEITSGLLSGIVTGYQIGLEGM